MSNREYSMLVRAAECSDNWQSDSSGSSWIQMVEYPPLRHDMEGPQKEEDSGPQRRTCPRRALRDGPDHPRLPSESTATLPTWWTNP